MKLMGSFFLCSSLSLALLQPVSAAAECARDIQVPLAPIGLSVTVSVIDGVASVGGVYPDVLRSVFAKEACNLQFSVVPRARLEALFEAGKADLLVPATRTPRRDLFGDFVPMVSSRALLISINPERLPVRSLHELLRRTELRVVLVRGYDYGEVYQGLIKSLSDQERLQLTVDPVSAARMLDGGMADLTLMAPSIFIGALQGDGRVRSLLSKLRYEALDELPWSDSGIYVSKTALAEPERQALIALLERTAKSGAVWRAFQHHYPAGSLKDSIRPR